MAIKRPESNKPAKGFTNRLKNMGRAWKTAKHRAQHEATGGMDDLADGSYICVVTKARLNESASSGRLQISWEYTILEGENRGRIIYEHAGLETEDNLMWTARRLAQLGYDISDMEIGEIETVLSDVIDEKIKVRVGLRTNGEFRNVRVQKNLGSLGRKETIPVSKPLKEQKMANGKDGNEDEDEDEEPEDEDDEEEEKIAAKSSTKSKKVPKKRYAKEEDEDDDESEDRENEDEETETASTDTDDDEETDEEGTEEDAEDGEDGEEDEAVEYAKGMNVMVFINGKSRAGKILKVDPKAEKATVHLTKLDKNVIIGYTELTPAEA